jgi:hypothetical protein
MAAAYQIDSLLRVKFVRIWGTTRYDELERLFWTYTRDPAFRSDLRILADLRDLTDVVAGLWEIRKLKCLYQTFYQDAARPVEVVIVVRGGIGHRAARAFALFLRDRSRVQVRICRDMGAARALLGLDPAGAPPRPGSEPAARIVWPRAFGHADPPG